MQTIEIPSGSIAVGVDGSASSKLALNWAAEQARAEGRPLTIIHAVTPTGAVWMDQVGHDTRIGHETGRTTAQRLLSHAREEVEQRVPGLDVHEVLRVADPRDVLLEASDEAAMVVVGSRGRGPVRSLLLGSVGVAVTHHARCPVVVLRPTHRGLVRNGVLVGVDGTERSREPLEFAFRQASQRGLPLTVVHAFHDVPAAEFDTGTDPISAELAEEHRLLLAEAVSGMREKYPDVSVRSQVARGWAGHCLVQMAERMNLVVVGAHHGGLATRILSGSVAAAVVEHASCPVAVVPTGEPR